MRIVPATFKGKVGEPIESMRCPVCRKPLKICQRKATGHKFLGCTGWPICPYTAEFKREDPRQCVMEFAEEPASASEVKP